MMNSRVVKTINGKYPKVMGDRDRPMLCAVESQTGGDTVNIRYRQENLMDLIAFTFSIKNDSEKTDYILQANGSSLELVQTHQLDQVDGFPKASWFEKDGYSEHYKVRVPFSNPQKYICIEGDTKGILILSDNVHAPRALVKDEAN